MSKKEKGRWTARRKMEAVIRLLKGESLELVSRELGVTAAKLTQWKESFLTEGMNGLKTRLADERDEEMKRLQAKVGELTMENELLFERSRRAEENLPFHLRKSKR